MSSSSSSSIRIGSMFRLDEIHPYQPPPWTMEYLLKPPIAGRLHLANLPTPLYCISIDPLPRQSPMAETTLDESTGGNDPIQCMAQIVQDYNMQLWIKRDDCSSGLELGGNKIRKLEFLLADALQQQQQQSSNTPGGRGAVLTIGGIQSNHCRATAAAARMVGLVPHLILRCPTTRNSSIGDEESDNPRNSLSLSNNNGNDLGLIGNLLVDRLVGSRIYTCTPAEYAHLGSNELLTRVQRFIQEQQQHSHQRQSCYTIPVGGSNGLGTWGYIEAVDEVMHQWTKQQPQPPSQLDHVVMACGSGGTTTGILLGMVLYHYHQQQQQQHNQLRDNTVDTTGEMKIPQIHAIGVCDDPDYFYNRVAEIALEMGLRVPLELASSSLSSLSSSSSAEASVHAFVRKYLKLHQGKGRGYAVSSAVELQFISAWAQATGTILDPVYTGKALYYFWHDVVVPNPDAFCNANVMFWHTGGGLGMYDKQIELATSTNLCSIASRVQRLDLYGKGNGIDISQSTSI